MRGKQSRMKGQIFPWRALRSSALKHRLKQSVSLATLSTHTPAPDTHFHQKLQLKHPTIDTHACVNTIHWSFTTITLLCYAITLFTSLLIETQYSFGFTGFYPTGKAGIQTYYTLHCSTHLPSATVRAPIEVIQPKHNCTQKLK